MIWASPSLITLTNWVRVRVRVTGDANITRVLGMGMPKTRTCPYCFDSATLESCSQRLLGSLLSRRSAISQFFILFQASVPEVFNSLQFPRFLCANGGFPRGGAPGFKWRGWSNGGKHQNPKTSLNQILTPKISPMPNFRGQVWLYFIRWTTGPPIFRLFWLPQISLL